MWILEKKFRFEAAHKLPLHHGKCARLHGHSWEGLVKVAGDTLEVEGSSTGMVLDYGEIKDVLDPIVEKYLDHHYLNETLGAENPTSEIVAKWLYDKLCPMLPGLAAVTIKETCTSSCTYFAAK